MATIMKVKFMFPNPFKTKKVLAEIGEKKKQLMLPMFYIFFIVVLFNYYIILLCVSTRNTSPSWTWLE